MNEPIRPSDVTTPATFGDRLRTARELNGLTVQQLADRLGCNAQTIHQLEADEFPSPAFALLNSLSIALYVSRDWLADGTDGPTTRSRAETAEILTSLVDGTILALAMMNQVLDGVEGQRVLVLDSLASLRATVRTTIDDCRLRDDPEGERACADLLARMDALDGRLNNLRL